MNILGTLSTDLRFLFFLRIFLKFCFELDFSGSHFLKRGIPCLFFSQLHLLLVGLLLPRLLLLLPGRVLDLPGAWLLAVELVSVRAQHVERGPRLEAEDLPLLLDAEGEGRLGAADEVPENKSELN